MQLNIKNGEAYRLAKAISERTGESLTEVVTRALREQLSREDAGGRLTLEAKAERLRRIREVVERYSALPVLDDRDPDEIIGYDENGLPR